MSNYEENLKNLTKFRSEGGNERFLKLLKRNVNSLIKKHRLQEGFNGSDLNANLLEERKVVLQDVTNKHRSFETENLKKLKFKKSDKKSEQKIATSVNVKDGGARNIRRANNRIARKDAKRNAKTTTVPKKRKFVKESCGLFLKIAVLNATIAFEARESLYKMSAEEALNLRIESSIVPPMELLKGCRLSTAIEHCDMKEQKTDEIAAERKDTANVYIIGSIGNAPSIRDIVNASGSIREYFNNSFADKGEFTPWLYNTLLSLITDFFRKHNFIFSNSICRGIVDQIEFLCKSKNVNKSGIEVFNEIMMQWNNTSVRSNHKMQRQWDGYLAVIDDICSNSHEENVDDNNSDNNNGTDDVEKFSNSKTLN